MRGQLIFQATLLAEADKGHSVRRGEREPKRERETEASLPSEPQVSAD